MSEVASVTPEPISVEPSRLYRWVVLVFISLAMFGNYYIYDSISPLADVLKAQLGFTDSNIGLLNAIYSIPNVIMVLIGGIIIDRIGTKKATLLFAVLCLFGAVITVLAGQLAVMAAGRLVFGLGAESLIVAVTTALAKWFRGKELSFAFGVNLTIARLGSFAALNSPSWAANLYQEWRLPLLISVGMGVVCVVGAVLYWVLEAGAAKRYSLGEADETDKFVLSDIFKFSKSYWYIVALFGLLVDKVAKRSLFMMLGSLLLIPVYLMMAYTRMPQLVLVQLNLDVGFLPSLIPVYLPVVMMGIAFSLIPAVMWPSVAYIVDQKKLGTAFGLMTMIQNIGLAGFNLLIGWSNDAAGASATNPAGYTPGMWIFSVLGILGLVFAFLLRRSETGPDAHGLETIKVGGES